MYWTVLPWIFFHNSIFRHNPISPSFSFTSCTLSLVRRFPSPSGERRRRFFLQVSILISLSLFMIYRDFYFFFDFVLLFHFCYSIQCLLFHNPIRSLLSVSLNFRYSISIMFRCLKIWMNVSYWWRISSFRFKSYLYFYFTTVWIIKVKIPKLKLYDMMYLQSVLILEWLALRYFEFLQLFSQMHWCDCEWIGFFFCIDCYAMTDIEKCFSKYV